MSRNCLRERAANGVGNCETHTRPRKIASCPWAGAPELNVYDSVAIELHGIEANHDRGFAGRPKDKDRALMPPFTGSPAFFPVGKRPPAKLATKATDLCRCHRFYL
jgi:hypothetical protein